MPRFIGEPIEPQAGTFDAGALSRGEPSLPETFRWNDEVLDVARIVRTWRSMKTDRGDAYVDKHWFAFESRAGATITVYFHRRAQRGAARWWLFSIEP